MKDNGREMVLTKIRSKGKLALLVSIPLCLITLFSELLLISTWEDDMLELFFLVSALTAECIFIVVTGIKRVFHPEKTIFIKRNPQIFEMTEQLFSSVEYEDRSVIMSDKVIANKKNTLQISYLAEIYMVYRITTSMDFLKYKNEILLGTRNKNNTIRISIKAKDRKKRDELFALLARSCPNARFGFSRENFIYLNEMREKAKSNN